MEIFWQLLAAVFSGFVMTVVAVSIGAFVVYKTKREDGVIVQHRVDRPDKPFHLDGEEFDDDEPGELPEEIEKKNKMFIKSFADRLAA